MTTPRLTNAIPFGVTTRTITPKAEAEQRPVEDLEVARVQVLVHPPTESNDNQVGCRLARYVQVWQSLNAHPRVIGILKDGYLLPFKKRPKLARNPCIFSHYQDAE